MNMETLYPKMDKILKVRGSISQIDQTIEECAELIQVLNKYKRSEANLENVYEELADVSLMMKQMQILFDISNDELMKRMKAKADRELQRIKAEMQ